MEPGCAPTFREALGVAVDLQRVQRRHLQVSVVVQELLHHRLQRQQKLFLLVQLLFGGRCQLLFVAIGVDLVQNELQETESKEDVSAKCAAQSSKNC